MPAVTICSDVGAQENTVYPCFHCSPSIYYAVMATDAMILVFWMLSFKPALSLSSFTSIKSFLMRFLFTFCHNRGVICISVNWYFSQQSWFQIVLRPASTSSSTSFHMMYSAYKLNKQGANIQPWCTPFPIWNQSIFPCCFLICTKVSQEADKTTWYSHLLKNFSQFAVIHTIKGFIIVNEAKVDVFSGILLLFLWSNRCW